MSSIAVVGPGAIGSTVAAWLSQDERHDVVVCTRSPRDEFRIDSPVGMISARPTTFTDPSQVSPVDWVVFAVKTYDVEAASAWLPRLLTPETRVAVLQNGVEHEALLRPYVAEERIVPVVVDIPAERRSDGSVLQHAVGTLIAPAGAGGDAFVDLFALTPIVVSTATDFVTTAWRKLCLNAAGAVCAAMRQPSGVAHQREIAQLIRDIVAEALAVGRAEGATLSDDLPDDVVMRMRQNPPMLVNSLLADRLAGRPTEIETRNGVVVRIGGTHGIPTPLNRMLCALVRASGVPGFGPPPPNAASVPEAGSRA